MSLPRQCERVKHLSTMGSPPALPEKVFTGIRMPSVWVAALKRRAAARGTDFSDEVRIAVSEYLEREKISLY